MEVKPHLDLVTFTPLKDFSMIGTTVSQCECVCRSVLSSEVCENINSKKTGTC